MSLIVFFSTDEGILVVGDRAKTELRKSDGDGLTLRGGAVHSSSKVHTYDNNTLFGVTGLPAVTLINAISGDVIGAFDIKKIIQNYARTVPYEPDGASFWKGLGNLVIAELGKAAGFQPPPDGFIVQSLFAHVPKDNSLWSFRCFRVFMERAGDQVRINTRVVPHAMPGTSVIGNDLVWLEIAGGKDARFENARKDPAIARYLDVRQAGPLNLKEASLFAKRLCAITSQRRLELEPVDTGHNVSAVTDGWLLTRAGWKQLWKNK